MKQFIEAGKIVTTHGVQGEVKLYIYCDGPEFVMGLHRLYFSDTGARETKLEQVRIHKNMCILKLAGVNSIEEARPFINRVAYFNRADVKLPKGRYYVQDILGCTVKDDATGEVYGKIIAIDHPGASDVYTIENETGARFLFPAVDAFLGEFCPDEGYISVKPIPGMFNSEGVSDVAD